MLNARTNCAVTRGALLAALLTLLAGCSPADRDRAAAETDTAVDRAGAAMGGAVDSVAGRIAGREYSNAELTGFLNAYNDAEVEIGQMAGPKATDAQVRAFARRVVSEHQALKKEVASTVSRLGLTPAVPGNDEDLIEDHREGMEDLGAKAKGKEFDEAFLEHEIEMHKKVLDEVEDALSRNRNPELKALLERARTGIRAHLQAAEELEKKFGTA